MYVKELAWLAAAGAIGTLARFTMAEWVQQKSQLSFPLGTLAVNCLGCFLFGIVWTLASDERLVIGPQTRFVLSLGFLGAFTTFSTFAFETTAMLSDGRWLMAAMNVASHNLFGCAAVLLGLATGRLLGTML